MDKIYSFNFRKNLSLVLVLGLAGIGFSQTAQQRREIKAQSNLEALQKLERKVARMTPKVMELKKMASDIGTKYSGFYKDTNYQFSGIYRDGIPRYLRTYNVGAAETTNTNKLYKSAGIFDLTGKGMTVGEWDGGGVLSSHVELVGRVTQKDNAPETNEHSTHVAGTMIATGVNPSARGMAYQAHLDAYEWTNDTREMAAAAADGMLVSNHSYGFSGGFEYGNYAGTPGWYWLGGEDEIEFKGFGKYTRTDIIWDNVMYNAPYYLAVKAAGNSRGDGPERGGQYFIQKYNKATGRFEWGTTTTPRPKNGGKYGFDCISYGTVGKNLLVVGAAEKMIGGYTKPSDIKISSFSSYGPTDDGRIKPDIVGAGVNIFSTSNKTDNSYTTMSGTSMASPNVTGSLLLLQQHYSNLNHKFMRAATLKALVLNTAKEAGDAPGPDYRFGFGLLDDFAAAKAISTDKEYSLLEERSLVQDTKDSDEIKVKASGNKPLKVTIAWQDPAPEEAYLTDENTLNDRKIMLVNDLDIVVERNGEKVYPWVLDPNKPNDPAKRGVNNVDNVEQVVIDNPVANAEYTIKVTHKKTLKNGKQDYSLVATGLAQVPVNDISLDNLKIKVDPGHYSTKTPVVVTCSNMNNSPINGAKIKYTLTNIDNNTISQSRELPIGNLKARETKEITFNVDLSHSFINYELKAEIKYNKDKVKVNNVKILRAYGIVSDLTSEGSRLDYGFEQSLASRGWTTGYMNSNTDTWKIYQDARIARSGNSSILNLTLNKVPDAWLYSNPLKLKAGQSYRVVYFARNANHYNDKFRVAVGSVADGKHMKPIGEEISLKTGKFVRYYAEFTPDQDGIYYVGFHNYTENNDQSYGIVLDDVTIMNTDGLPYVDFSASYKEPSTYEKVTFNNETLSGPKIISYQWEFSPNTVEFLDGTNRNSENPVVRFKEQGFYDVKLKVTNGKGGAEEFKQDYMKVANIPVEPDFKASKNVIYDNNKVQLIDLSTGRPFPNHWRWEITPSTDVYFVDNTTETSRNPFVLFGRNGKYTVTLRAASQLGEKTRIKQNFIEVNGKHYPVNNLGYQLRENRVDLVWDRPFIRPVYSQSFEDGGRMPSRITLFDEDGDGSNWFIENDKANVSEGNYSAKSISRFASTDINERKRDIKNWLVTEKIKAGSEEFRIDVKSPEHDRFKIYIVPADKVHKLSPREIKLRGVKIYDFNGEQRIPEFKTLSFDLSKFKTDDIYIAVLHCTRKSDDSSSLMIDNLQVGYRNVENRPIEEEHKTTSAVSEQKDLLKPFYKDILEKFNFRDINNTSKLKVLAAADDVTRPNLVGYEVVRNGKSYKTIHDINDTKLVDILKDSGHYTYDVYALYSDGDKSIWQRVNLDAKFIIPTVQKGLDKSGIIIYPNPTDGRFKIKLPEDAMDCKLALYDLTGKLILMKNNVIEQEKQDFSYLKAGVYILKVEDNKGRKASFKLVKK